MKPSKTELKVLADRWFAKFPLMREYYPRLHVQPNMTEKQTLIASINDMLDSISDSIPAIPASVDECECDENDLLLAQQHAIAAIGAAAQLDAHIAGIYAALDLESNEEEEADDDTTD